MTAGQPQMSRAERARAAAEEEKRRIDALQRKGEEEAGDVVISTVASVGGTAGTATSPIVESAKTESGDSGAAVVAEEPKAVVTTSQTASASGTSTTLQQQQSSANGVSADRPMAEEKKKVDRQGIDLRPEDRERVIRFEMFCLQNRLKTGKKRGLTLYARAGFQLLEDLISTDRAKAEALLRSLGEKR